jgi:hypothetical protein
VKWLEFLRAHPTNAGSDCVWDMKTPESWVRAVDAASWQIIGIPGEVDGYRKSMSCPRCGHSMEITKLGAVAPGFPSLFASLVDQVEPSERTPGSCTCHGAHQGRPEGRDGCGQLAWIERPRP